MPIGPQGERLPYPGEPGAQGPPQGGPPAQPPMPGMGGGMAPQMPAPNPAVTDLETIRRMKDAEVAKLMGKPLHQAFSSTPPIQNLACLTESELFFPNNSVILV